ncbi:hypothetical protein RB195_018070 [Necator americanus]|uniref:Uncharacterized protein n=1 Tax=Necator americanus TaxID=51031 RepID=A0ABR1C9M9_NECAM
MQKEVPSTSVDQFWIRRSVDDANSLTKCIQDAAKKTLQVLGLRKKFALAFAETISTHDSVYVTRTTGDFSQDKRLRELRRQVERDRENRWTSRGRLAWGLSIWREHVKNLLDRQAPSVRELVHAQRQIYTTVREDSPTESEVHPYSKNEERKIWRRRWNCRRNAEISSPSGIRGITKTIRSISTDEKIISPKDTLP